jgi:predicted nuclease with TOPRIM domain
VKPKKAPQQTAEDKLKYQKTRLNKLEKMVTILKDRIGDLEKRLDRVTPKKEEADEDKLQDWLNEHSPQRKNK